MKVYSAVPLRLVGTIVCVFNLVHATTSPAATVFFSEVGMPVLVDPGDPQSPYVAPTTLTVGDVPIIDMLVGDTKVLHVWIRPDDYPPVQAYYAVAIDVDSSNPAAAHATDFVVSNFFNRNAGENRWDATVAGIVEPAGTIDWLTNAYGFRVLATGVNNNPLFAGGDAGFDSGSGSFYFGNLTFSADAPGTTGLFFRTGDFLSILAQGLGTPAPLQYGGNVVSPPYAGNVAGSGDAITPDLDFADAIIRVSVPEPSTWIMLASAGLFFTIRRRRLWSNIRKDQSAKWHSRPVARDRLAR